MSITFPPYVGLCVIFRDNLDTMPTLLASIAGHFDDYQFTDTGSKDGSRQLIEEFLKTNPGKVTDFEWCDDFAKARNFNFSQSHAHWKMFLDADDKLENGHNVRLLLMEMEAREPSMCAFFVPYIYGHLEELGTMRICRAVPGWQWNDSIHERLEFTPYSLPDQAYGRATDFQVVHKNKTPEEKARAIFRNARIAEREYALTSDIKYKARLARTIAMEMKMQNKLEESVPFLQELHSHYAVFPEGRQGAADIAKAKLTLGEKDDANRDRLYAEAMEWAKKAGPAYESLVHHARGEKKESIKDAQRSLGRGQQATHEGFVYEQGTVYVIAAKAVVELKGPRWPDVAEHILNYIPAKLRNEEQIAPHINAIRAQIDRITIVVPGTPQPFDENGGGGMLGGSEEAVMYLTRGLAQMGRNVRVYGVLPPQRLPGPDKYGVDWQPMSAFQLDNEHGTLVLWRAPAMLLQLMQAAGQRHAPLAGTVQAFLWLHDSGLGVPPHIAKQLTAEGAVVLSDFHAGMIQQGGLTGMPMYKLSNGITEADFEKGEHRDPMSVVYSSCPSRGLVQLLQMWPSVKEAVPEAKLDIYYDWSMIESHQPRKYEEVKALYDSVRHLDVVHHGGVDHATLHKALKKANVWAYSHFESPQVETFCISAVKAQAAGATVLTVPNGALPEVTQGEAIFCTDTESYKNELIHLLRNPDPRSERNRIAKKAIAKYGWKTVSKQFSDLWSVSRRIPLSTAQS